MDGIISRETISARERAAHERDNLIRHLCDGLWQAAYPMQRTKEFQAMIDGVRKYLAVAPTLEERVAALEAKAAGSDS